MRVLVAARLKAEPEEHDRLREFLDQAKDGNEYIPDTDLDWPGMRDRYGGFGGAYQAAARIFDQLVLIEGKNETGYFVARGQHTLIHEFLRRRKQVSAYREGHLVQIIAITAAKLEGENGARESHQE